MTLQDVPLFATHQRRITYFMRRLIKIKQTLKTQLTKIIFSVQMGRTQEICLICFTLIVLISTQDDEDLDTDEIIRYVT